MQQLVSIYVPLIIAAILATSIDAKRGCNLYGHSCYGGHGKRSTGVDILPLDKTGYRITSDEDDISMPMRTNQIDNLHIYPRYHFIKMIQQWLQDNHHSEKNSDSDNYFPENPNKDNLIN